MIIPVLSIESETCASRLVDGQEPSRWWYGHGTLPGSLPARDIAMTDLTLMGNRAAHADYYIEEGSVSITLSGRSLTVRQV